MSRLQLLTVDDSPVVRSVVKIYLRDLPFDFHEAESGERALQLVSLVRLDLLIVDINMPRMSGFDLVARLRAHEREHVRSIPVILLTADKTGELPRRGATVGANAFLRKPVSSAGLTDAVKKLLPLAFQAPPA